MGFKCGIVGLPNVGKSTIFNALTSGKAEAANFPFCTIEPNTGIVRVPDPRLQQIADRVKPKSLVPATMTFVDIAGLVKGASKGEGLGNQFLGHIRETQAVAHVVRCFGDPNVIHVDGGVDPKRDIAVIDTELMLADLDAVTKKYNTIQKAARSGADKEAARLFSVIEPVKAALEAGRPVRSVAISPEDKVLLEPFHFLTGKKVMYVANVDEKDIANPDQNPWVREVKEHAKLEGSSVVTICGKIEAEISELGESDRIEFLKEVGLTEPGLYAVIREGYRLLGLQTYFTAGEKEVRAWTIEKGWRAPQAAGVIHTDFERGFIKAEVYHVEDLVQHGSVPAIRDAGLLRLEGKEYIVKDGDVMLFRFNA